MKKRIITIAVVLAIICLGFFTIKYFQSLKEDQSHQERFVKDFYYSMNDTIAQLEYMLSDQFDNKNVSYAVRDLENDLLKDYYITKNARNFINYNLYPGTFLKDSSRLLYGANSIVGETSFPPIDQDGVLSEKEKVLLTSIHNHLTRARSEMLLEGTNHVNESLSIKEMNEIIVTHFSDNIIGIYKEAYQ
ncbi:hypothetical protein EQV77_14895 [Halobacillus fulvus]|nr:hypothetical protein EQV77_14895 [Halobacillus fulvus]